MNIIDRYLLKSLLVPFAVCFTAFYMFWVIYDMFSTLPDMLKHGAPLLYAVELYITQLPRIAQIILPICYFFAVLYVLVGLSNNQELVALQSGGRSLARISVPFFLLSFLVAGAQLMLFVRWTPEAAQRKEEVEARISGREHRAQTFRAVVYKNPKTGTMWYVQEVAPSEGVVRQAEILVTDELGRDKTKYFVARGNYRDGYWDLAGIRKVEFDRDGTAAAPEDVAQLDAFFLTEPPGQLVSVQRRSREIPWGELVDFIHAPYRPPPIRMAPYMTEHYYRMAYPFFSPVLCLFAFGMGITTNRQNKAASAFRCLGVMLALLVWLNLSLALGDGMRISAFLAGWNTVLMFGAAGLAMFAHRVGWWWELMHYSVSQKFPEIAQV